MGDDLSQPSVSADANHSTTTKNPQNLSTEVSSIVDGIVENATANSALQTEKRNVQNLISKLVSRVRDDAIKSDATVNLANKETQPPQSHNYSRGVPLGDHRQRKCSTVPVTWTQSMDAVTLSVDVPASVRKQQVSVSFAPGAVKASVSQPHSAQTVVLFDEPLVAAISVDGCMWALEEEGHTRKLIIEIEKLRVQWWARLFMSDDPAQYSIVTPKPASRSNMTSESVDPDARENNTASISAPQAPQPASSAASKEQADLSDDEVSASSSLEDVVSNVVSDTVKAAVSAAAGQGERAGSKQDSLSKREAAGPSVNRPRKVLTRADIPNIVDQCKKVIEKGGADACESALQLATFYHHGLGVAQDDAEAARLYKYALENGMLDPSAAFQLGLIYNQGAPGLEADLKEAVRWWRVSASLRNPVAMFNLGVMYMNGAGCDMDPLMATQWFQQAQALDPRLQPPQFSRAQLEERIATAMKQKKERLKRTLSPEEKAARKELALQKARTLAYGTATIVGISLGVMLVRHWWRNRL